VFLGSFAFVFYEGKRVFPYLFRGPLWPSPTKSTRHVKRRLKAVRKLRNFGVIALDYVNTSKNLVDQFTKGLSRNVIEGASRELGIRPT
jgi:hypothetical protein